MSALLNTITLYRSERDLRRIYCLLISGCVCVCMCVEMCVIWDYMPIIERFLLSRYDPVSMLHPDTVLYIRLKVYHHQLLWFVGEYWIKIK